MSFIFNIAIFINYRVIQTNIYPKRIGDPIIKKTT